MDHIHAKYGNRKMDVPTLVKKMRKQFTPLKEDFITTPLLECNYVLSPSTDHVYIFTTILLLPMSIHAFIRDVVMKCFPTLFGQKMLNDDKEYTRQLFELANVSFSDDLFEFWDIEYKHNDMLKSGMWKEWPNLEKDTMDSTS